MERFNWNYFQLKLCVQCSPLLTPKAVTSLVPVFMVRLVYSTGNPCHDSLSVFSFILIILTNWDNSNKNKLTSGLEVKMCLKSNASSLFDGLIRSCSHILFQRPLWVACGFHSKWRLVEWPYENLNNQSRYYFAVFPFRNTKVFLLNITTCYSPLYLYF